MIPAYYSQFNVLLKSRGIRGNIVILAQVWINDTKKVHAVYCIAIDGCRCVMMSKYCNVRNNLGEQTNYVGAEKDRDIIKTL